METTPQTVRETLASLQARPRLSAERRAAALAQFWEFPPSASEHPRLAPLATPSASEGDMERGIRALALSAPRCLEPAKGVRAGVMALILAGNTPLLAWPVLHYAVLLGIPVFIKQSREETLWTRVFVERLAEIDPDVAALLHLDLFPGDDPRTEALVQSADAVIAYGGDSAIAALRAWTPEATPFLGFGHALSVGIWVGGEASGFARDTLAYDQAGCLSPQAVFTPKCSLEMVSELLQEALGELGQAPRTDPAECRVVREARTLALMEGCKVFGDNGLRWTLVVHPEPCSLPLPIGFCVLHLIPLDDLAQFGAFLGPAKGRLSSVGVAGELSDELRPAILVEGVSRICAAGEMQAPPLDWPNGRVDLRAWLLDRF